jgi:hypothetical protein
MPRNGGKLQASHGVGVFPQMRRKPGRTRISHAPRLEQGSQRGVQNRVFA